MANEQLILEVKEKVIKAVNLVDLNPEDIDALVELACEGAALLLADCGLSSADYNPSKPHYSAALCGQLAANTRAKALLLTHFNPKYDPADLLDEAREHFPAARLADLGDVYYI